MITRIFLLFTGFTNLFLGSAVFLYNPRKKINQIYFFLAFGLLSLAAILISWNIDLFSRAGFAGAAILVSALLLFSLYINEPEVKISKIKLIIPAMLGFIFVILILITELVIKGSTFVNHALESVPGPLYFPFLLYFALSKIQKIGGHGSRTNKICVSRFCFIRGAGDRHQRGFAGRFRGF
ncbi:MAG: hypothetical protein UX51_C0036G0010 [Candidatus Azambacteria bacterium GW2011_GWF2_46_32]|uniref:Uncharacterized protein n=1 Tax=Candidatus Azambacteria bacterium GW2011_GWF2_46_32 TaxID=1618628 RepID=A0A0G1PVW1_9BACT|nr:MAG: hypothetical protein UX51_C0036G0010 [Candidatus Azambacteria bacterium GW2011_GWF2_46_32]